MTKNTQRRTPVSRLLGDRLGNFSIMTAIVLPVLLAAGGVAMDLTNMVMTKTTLQDATDSAALAAASALANDGLTPSEARLVALQFLKTQIMGGTTVADAKKKGDEIAAATTVDIKETALLGNGKAFTVEVSTRQTIQFNVFTRLLGQTSTVMTAKSSSASAKESKNALSMFLVLDRSGSMSWITDEIFDKNTACQNHTRQNWYSANLKKTKPCYVTKIGALKLAVASLFTQLSTADPKNLFVRTGTVTYNDRMLPAIDLDWGTAGALAEVNAIPSVPQGGTDSSGAFATAYEKVKASTEDIAHHDKNGQVPTKYIVFMTDGENTHFNGVANDKASDTATKASCDAARADKIEVYTVAFMAPSRGQELLQYCATTSNHYFEAANMAALVAAFKEIGQRTAAVVARLTK